MRPSNDKVPVAPGALSRLHDRALDSLQKGKLADAESFSRQALSLAPADPGLLNLLGQSLLAQKRPAEAAEVFVRAIQNEPNLPNLHYNLALALQAEGRLVEAIQAVRRAAELDPKAAAVQAKLGQLRSMMGDFAEAVPALRRALALDPRSLPVRMNLAQALADAGDLEEAGKLVRGVLALHPDDPLALRLLGRIAQMAGRFEDAAVAFTKAIQQDPNYAAAYFSLAYARPIAESDRPLLAAMERLLPRATLSDQGLLSYALGKGYDDLAEYDAAMDWFDRANAIALEANRAGGKRYDPQAEAKRIDDLIATYPPGSFAGGDIERPIFIVGMIRSGTTLVEQILSRHPEVAAGGENPFFLRRAALDPVTLDRGVLRTEYEADLDRFPAARRVTDKMPLNYWAIGLILTVFPGARIVHCRRNPLDTCLSVYTTPYRSSPDFAHDLDSIASAYRAYLRLMSHWRKLVPPSQFLEIDYEALVETPEPKIAELVSFAGLPWDEACLDPSHSQTPVNTPSHWQARQPIYRSSVSRWRAYAPRLTRLQPLDPSADLG